MKYLIKYYDIEYGASMFASPTYTKEEIVDAKSQQDLDKYISTKKDMAGHKYREDKKFGYTHISNQGALKVSKVLIKKI